MDLPVRSKIRFLFVGNQACLDFINTDLVVNEQPTDLLCSLTDIISWVVEAGLATEQEGKRLERENSRHGAETLKQVKAFRTTMREMVEGLAAGKAVPPAALDAINERLRYRVGYPQISRRNDLFERRYELQDADRHRLLALLAEAASDLLCTCDPALIKKCQNRSCVLFFYDTTKNHARHWCSMSLCGNRSKVAAHYHRHKKRSK